MKRKIILSIVAMMAIAINLLGCNGSKNQIETISMPKEKEQQMETSKNNIKVDLEDIQEKETTSEISEIGQSKEKVEEKKGSKTDNPNEKDIYFDSYDETQLKFVTYTKPAWFLLQIVDDKYLTLMEPVKGDASCIIIDDEGQGICEGLTDSMYGETYISKYEGKTVAVVFYMDEEGTERIAVLDMEGNVLTDYEGSFEDNEEKFPYLKNEMENKEISIEIKQDGVYVKNAAKDQIAFFKNAYPDYQPKREDEINSLYGEIRGNFLFVYQISPVDGEEWDEESMWIYKIL